MSTVPPSPCPCACAAQVAELARELAVMETRLDLALRGYSYARAYAQDGPGPPQLAGVLPFPRPGAVREGA
jgi:hypothetical protein